jgi:hypothetical protein
MQAFLCKWLCIYGMYVLRYSVKVKLQEFQTSVSLWEALRDKCFKTKKNVKYMFRTLNA